VSTPRILLLQLKRIGDFILTAPAVAAVRAANPGAHITAVVPESVADLATAFTGLDETLVWRQGEMNARLWYQIATCGWDLCLDFSGTDRTALMARLSRAKTRVGYAKFADKSFRAASCTQLSQASVRELHTVDFHLALVCEVWPEATPEDSGFRIPPAMLERAADVATNHVVVHPGTARAEKYWPPERWAEVITHLVTEWNLSVVITGSADMEEQRHLTAVKKNLAVPMHDLSGQLSLIQTAAVISGARLALGVDSMAMHLAAMLERPQVVLFGPTNPHHWRPRHDSAVVLQAGRDGPVVETQPRAAGADMNLISTQQVLGAIHSLRARLMS
jgi:ADP-heptose:LPS heptosyltransferase